MSSSEHPGQGIVVVTTFVLMPSGHFGQGRVVWTIFVVTRWLEELALVMDKEGLTEDEVLLAGLELGLDEHDEKERDTDELVVGIGEALLDDLEDVVLTLRLEVLETRLLVEVVVFFCEVEKEGVEVTFEVVADVVLDRMDDTDEHALSWQAQFAPMIVLLKTIFPELLDFIQQRWSPGT